jgi:pseudouridine-5'-phosphate glycosidase
MHQLPNFSKSRSSRKSPITISNSTVADRFQRRKQDMRSELDLALLDDVPIRVSTSR